MRSKPARTSLALRKTPSPNAGSSRAVIPVTMKFPLIKLSRTESTVTLRPSVSESLSATEFFSGESGTSGTATAAAPMIAISSSTLLKHPLFCVIIQTSSQLNTLRDPSVRFRYAPVSSYDNYASRAPAPEQLVVDPNLIGIQLPVLAPPKRRSTMVRNHFQLRIARCREGFCALHLLRFTRNINHPLTISLELQWNRIYPTESRMNESKTAAPADVLIALLRSSLSASGEQAFGHLVLYTSFGVVRGRIGLTFAQGLIGKENAGADAESPHEAIEINDVTVE